MMQPVRAVICDDEPLAREGVRSLLEERGGIEVVAECGDGAEAVSVLADRRPDLVFLDVQMPELDGFGVLEALDEELGDELPVVVFVTAYDEYALRAFEARALDYLLKPFKRTRFEQALERALRQVELAHAGAGPAPGAEAGSELRALLSQLRAERAYAAPFVARGADGITVVRPDEIDWVDAAGNYARLHVKGRAHLVRETMKNIEARLDPRIFVRVHRSTIVNVGSIRTLQPYFHGEYVVVLRDGTRLTSSRTHSARLRRMLRA